MNGQNIKDLLSLAGNWASVVGFLIVIFQLNQNSDSAQLHVWKIIFATIMLLLGTTSSYYFGKKIVQAIQSQESIEKKILKFSLFSVSMLIFLAIFIDGFFAAYYWRFWLGDIVYSSYNMIYH